jgi:hypothetical protein
MQTTLRHNTAPAPSRILRGARRLSTVPLPHPSWRAAGTNHDEAREPISASDFWRRLGL